MRRISIEDVLEPKRNNSKQIIIPEDYFNIANVSKSDVYKH